MWEQGRLRERIVLEIRLQGSHEDLLWGMVVGFFIGVVVLFWIKEHGMFNRRQQMGIIVGLLINTSLGVMRYVN
jgi:hypothetical protein